MVVIPVEASVEASATMVASVLASPELRYSPESIEVASDETLESCPEIVEFCDEELSDTELPRTELREPEFELLIPELNEGEVHPVIIVVVITRDVIDRKLYIDIFPPKRIITELLQK
jgi:hypothetical protein